MVPSIVSPGPQKSFDHTQTLEKAMHVFWQHGFEGTSLSQLLAEMGIGKKSLYDTYGNKRQLFLKALDLYAQQSLGQVKEKLDAPGSPLDNIEALFTGFQGEGCRGCFYGTNMADFDANDGEIAQRFCQHLKAFEQALTSALERAKAQGELTPAASPQEVAQMLCCLTQGTALVSRVGQCRGRQETALATVFKLIRG